MVNLCNWKLPWLLPEHISMFTPILVHLSEYLYASVLLEDLSDFNNSISFITKFGQIQLG